MPYFVRFLWEVGFAAVFTALAFLIRRRFAVTGSRISGRRAASFVLLAILGPMALRLALLPWIPVPQPTVHDEFSHLLVADTIAAGRLANPPHPMWRHLETIYVLQQPAYASIYPLGPGMILAAGRLLTGHPWAGVLLATALMCGATSWMLFGCLPPNWAAIGSLLASFALATRWMDSYFGGAFCAFGGALLFGALARLRRSPSPLMGLIAGLGWSIVWFTRPFESLPLFVLVWGFMAAFTIREPRRWRTWLWPVFIVLAVEVSAGCLTALHNRAVTGSFTTTPYQLSQRVYGVPQSLLWQEPIEEPPLEYKELKEMYRWQWATKESASQNNLRHLLSIFVTVWKHYVTPWYSLPIVLLIFARDRDVFAGAGMLVLALMGGVLYAFSLPHYYAAYSCVIFFLIVRGTMVLSSGSFRGKAVGRWVALFLMMGGSVMGLRLVPLARSFPGLSAGDLHAPGFREGVAQRSGVTRRLMELGGRHLVFVRYAANHNFHDEWVYNAADVDGSRIVWCRTLGPAGDLEAVRYFKDRRVWVVDVDGNRARLSPYAPDVASSVP